MAFTRVSRYLLGCGRLKPRRGIRRNKTEDLITLRRVITNPCNSASSGTSHCESFIRVFDFGPNLEIIPKVSAAYEQLLKKMRQTAIIFRQLTAIPEGCRLFSLRAQSPERGGQWFSTRREISNKPLLDNRPDSLRGILLWTNTPFHG